jgi:hypothetical protein
VAAPRASDGQVRTRPRYLDDAVRAAARRGGIALADTAVRAASTWRLLKAPRIVDLRSEDDDQANGSALVSRLVSLGR